MGPCPRSVAHSQWPRTGRWSQTPCSYNPGSAPGAWELARGSAVLVTHLWMGWYQHHPPGRACANQGMS